MVRKPEADEQAQQRHTPVQRTILAVNAHSHHENGCDQ